MLGDKVGEAVMVDGSVGMVDGPLLDSPLFAGMEVQCGDCDGLLDGTVDVCNEG